jgi:uncharacterized protein (TIGR02145 family)
MSAKNVFSFLPDLLFPLLLISLFTTCKKEDDIPDPVVSLPKVQTVNIVNIGPYSAEAHGNIISNGGDSITGFGFCQSTDSLPTLSDSIKYGILSGQNFTAALGNLSPETRYFVRAFATNSVGTSYGDTISFVSSTEPPVFVTDLDGNVYTTVKIGPLRWMVENLKTTTFNDGTPIELAESDSLWSDCFAPAYCWYSNNLGNKNTYGALYNGYAVHANKLCPNGWRLPYLADYWSLENFVGGATIGGGKLKQEGFTHWLPPNTGANNETGFTALPGGIRSPTGHFSAINESAYFWFHFGDPDATYQYQLNINYNSRKIHWSGQIRPWGMSVRCVQDL